MRRIAPRNSIVGGMVYRCAAALLLSLLLAACSPREVPPQLAATPAPAYRLTERLLTTDIYSVAPPVGWRVIAGPAEDSYTFQFVAPDNTAIIVVSDHEISEPPVPLAADASSLAIATQTADVSGQPLVVILVAPDAALAGLLPVRDAVVASLRDAASD